jgi:hypothetical protein
MSSAVLLNSGDPLFAFENMMAHRRYFAAMAPLDRFSALPYMLDPPYNTSVRASDWHLNHQKAHTDFAATLPRDYNASAPPQVASFTPPLMDSDLSNPEELEWWTFQHHRDHYLADQATLPLLTGTWPFW